MALKLYRIWQDDNSGYDTYDSAVVAAPNLEAARSIHPDGSQRWIDKRGWVYAKGHDGQGSGWGSPDRVEVALIGVAADDVEEGVICASYNAG